MKRRNGLGHQIGACSCAALVISGGLHGLSEARELGPMQVGTRLDPLWLPKLRRDRICPGAVQPRGLLWTARTEI